MATAQEILLEDATLTAAVVAAREHSDQSFFNLSFLAKAFLHAQLSCPDGITLEVGTRHGGSALLFLKLLDLLYRGRGAPPVITVDPYGGKPYEGGDEVAREGLYGDATYLKMKRLLAGYANHQHLLLTSREFFSRMGGFRFWHNGKQVDTNKGLSFVFLDGDHDAKTIEMELECLFDPDLPWVKPGGLVAVDDTLKDPATAAALERFSVVGGTDYGLVVVSGRKT